MDLKGLHYTDQDPVTKKWFVVFDGARLKGSYHLQEGAEIYLARLVKLLQYRPKRGRPRKHHIKLYEPTRQWAVYFDNRFMGFKSTELEAVEFLENLINPQL
jgi:hypothetical protein